MQYPYELKDIHCFVQVARAGSLTRAAATTNIPKATLSHNLRRLEDALDVELFVRGSRGLTLTDAGKAYLESCSRIFDTCESAASAAQRAHSAISGKVKIAASAEFGTSIIGAAAYYISEAYPQIDFELHMYPSDALFVEEVDFDCVIYVGTPPDSNLMCRKLGTVSYGLYATPATFEKFGRPQSADALRDLPGVLYTRNGIAEDWCLTRDGEDITVDFYPRFNVHDYWMAKYFAVAGNTIAYLPDFFVHYEVELGALVPILPDWRSEETSVFALYPSYRHRNMRVMVVVDTLCKEFNQFIRHPGYSLISPDR